LPALVSDNVPSVFLMTPLKVPPVPLVPMPE